MAAIPAARDQWYVVHVFSGQEAKVKDNIARRIVTEEMSDYIFEVLLPMERVSEVKQGRKSETKRKVFPGYLLINMNLLHPDGGLVDKTWYFIKDTQGVIHFAGNRDRPTPMKQKEVESMLLQIRERSDTVKPKVAFDAGDTVKVNNGPFDGQIGVVEEIDHEHGKLRVSVNIFGRNTPLDLEFWQVEKEKAQ
ncbi:MAG: transcription termination/antitermination factor NusG [Verrucomicrobiales bacterium]|nr:transcription termination/antitermination factor NusG [Verrucomicrobiales bacterium]